MNLDEGLLQASFGLSCCQGNLLAHDAMRGDDNNGVVLETPDMPQAWEACDGSIFVLE